MKSARQAVRGDLRPHGHSRARTNGPRVLPRARRHPRRVDADAGAHQGLHRAAQVERLSVAAHDRVRPPERRLYEIQIRTREIHQHGGVRHRGALALQGAAPGSGRAAERMAWFRQMLEAQLDAQDARGVPRVAQARSVRPGDLRLHADRRRDPAAEGRDADRLCLRRAQSDRRALPGGQSQRAHRAALEAAPELRHGRDPHVAERAAESRLAGARAHGTGASQDPPVDQAGRAEHVGESRTRDPGQGSAPPRLAKPDDAALAVAASALGLSDAKHLDRLDRAGRPEHRAGAEDALPRSRASHAGAARQADGVRAAGASDARQREGRAHPGCRRLDGAILAVLPTGARRCRGRLRHPRSRRQHPPAGLSERAAPLVRAGAPTGHRLAGGERGALPGPSRPRGDPIAADCTPMSPTRSPRPARTSRAWSSAAATAVVSRVRCWSRSRTWLTCRASSGRCAR